MSKKIKKQRTHKKTKLPRLSPQEILQRKRNKEIRDDIYRWTGVSLDNIPISQPTMYFHSSTVEDYYWSEIVDSVTNNRAGNNVEENQS